MQTKAKRKLTDITFDAKDAHVSLVTKEQGGPANGKDKALVIKSARSKEFVEKIQQVRVSMELDDFLRYFFNVYGTQADMLAAMMGYSEDESESDAGMFHPNKSFYEWRCDKWEAANPGMECPDDVKWAMETDEEYKEYIDSMLSGIEIIKSLAQSENIQESIAELDEDTHLDLVLKQVKFEKAEKKFKAEQKKAARKAAKSKTTDGETMTKSATPSGTDAGTEVTAIEKSVHESVLKQLEDTKVALQKATDELTALQAEKQEQVEKARFAAVKDAVKDEAKATVLFKSLKGLEQADFDASVETLAQITKQADAANDLFNEKGAEGNGATAPKQESAVAKAVKARQAKAA